MLGTLLFSISPRWWLRKEYFQLSYHCNKIQVCLVHAKNDFDQRYTYHSIDRPPPIQTKTTNSYQKSYYFISVSLTSIICIHQSKAKLSRFFFLSSSLVHDPKSLRSILSPYNVVLPYTHMVPTNSRLFISVENGI